MFLAILGLMALGAPMILVFIITVCVERADGRSRFVIVDGRTRRRSRVELNK